MITKTEILYAFSRLQEQDDLPENVNEFMRDAALSKLAGEELKEGGGMNLQQVFDKHIHYWTNNEGEAFISSRDSEENKLPQAIKNAMDEYAAQFACSHNQDIITVTKYWEDILKKTVAERDWINVEDRTPEHNLGVLVFIPAEDNHVTSGMWDISNEWVLLDEYRSPQGEVTHWRPLPNPPNTNILKPI